MRIGELAERAGVAPSRIRFYEAKGLLPPGARRANGYRDYDARAVEVVRFITRAQSLGFSLKDIEAHLRSPTADDARKARLQHRLETKLEEIDAHLAEVQARRVRLLEVLAEVRDLRDRARTVEA